MPYACAKSIEAVFIVIDMTNFITHVVVTNEVFLSVISVWEISIKYQLGKLSLPLPPEFFLPAERQRHLIQSLELDEADTHHINRLPQIHRDPFDRMLVCQAIERSLTILTPDPLIRNYPIRTLW